ncbi:MAG: hypothetical protein ABH875_06550, partial [Candidatus Omnitrophota bacterium]
MGIMPKRNIHIGSASLSVSVAGSYKVEDLDIGYRIPKAFLLAFAASNIPDDTSLWTGNVWPLIELVNTQYMALTGTDEPLIDIDIETATAEDLAEALKRKKDIHINLPPIQRLDFDSSDELEMAQEALKAV